MALPDAVEKISHGEPAWFAGKGKMFAMLDNHHHGAPHLSVWLPAPIGAQETLVWGDPKRYFRPPYVGPQGWVGVVLDTKPDWKLVAALVEEAYRLVAHPRLVRRLDEPTHLKDSRAISAAGPARPAGRRPRGSPPPPSA